MFRKDLGLLVLILVIGAITAWRQPLFLSPINIANTANLVGLFGIFAIGQAFVIINAGIELSSGSVIALLGVLFIDMIANRGVPWPLAILSILILGIEEMIDFEPVEIFAAIGHVLEIDDALQAGGNDAVHLFRQ